MRPLVWHESPAEPLPTLNDAWLVERRPRNCSTCVHRIVSKNDRGAVECEKDHWDFPKGTRCNLWKVAITEATP